MRMGKGIVTPEDRVRRFALSAIVSRVEGKKSVWMALQLNRHVHGVVTGREMVHKLSAL
jgi:hypothetical protein